MERDPGSNLLVKCEGADGYTGEGRPKCDHGKGCIACWRKHNDWLDETRPPMSADFQEFYDYVCMYKRMLQNAKFKSEDFPAGSMYDTFSAFEKTMRTGEYRHKKIVLEQTFKELYEDR